MSVSESDKRLYLNQTIASAEYLLVRQTTDRFVSGYRQIKFRISDKPLSVSHTRQTKFCLVLTTDRQMPVCLRQQKNHHYKIMAGQLHTFCSYGYKYGNGI